MIVIATGPDFAGKSTLLDAIASKTTKPVIKMHNGTYARLNADELLASYSQQLDDAYAASHAGQLVLIDRASCDEFIYGPVYRGSSRLTLQQVIALDEVTSMVGAVKLYVNPGIKTLVERFGNGRGDDVVMTDAELITISDSYDKLMPQLNGWLRIEQASQVDFVTGSWL